MSRSHLPASDVLKALREKQPDDKTLRINGETPSGFGRPS
jgi:hypothetical protein